MENNFLLQSSKSQENSKNRLEPDRISINTQATSFNDVFSTDRPLDEKGWRDERQAWDIFKVTNSETRYQESHAMIKCIQQLVLILAHGISFILVLGSSLMSYATFIFMTSNIKMYKSSLNGGQYSMVRISDGSVKRDPLTSTNKTITKMILPKFYEIQLCNNTNITSQPYEWFAEPGPRWIWVLFTAISLPQVFTFIKSAKKIVLRKRTKPTPMIFVLTFLAETFHSIAVGIITFDIMPNIDAVTACMLAPSICLIPSILQPLSRPPDCSQYIPKLLLDLAGMLCQLSALIYWIALSFDPIYISYGKSDHWKITVVLLLISWVWWDNYMEKSSRLPCVVKLARYKDLIRRARPSMHLFLSLWNILIYFVLMIILSTNYYSLKELFNFQSVFYYETEEKILIDSTDTTFLPVSTPKIKSSPNLFNFSPNSSTSARIKRQLTKTVLNTTLSLETTDSLDSIIDSLDSMSGLLQSESFLMRYKDCFVVMLISVGSAFILYYVSAFSCKTVMQKFSFAFPILTSNVLLVYIMMFLTESRLLNPCFMTSVVPSHLFWNLIDFNPFAVRIKPRGVFHSANSLMGYANNRYDAMGNTGYLWLVWTLSMFWITSHIWYPKGERLEQTSKLFTLPMYCPVFTATSLLLSRARETTEGEVKHNIEIDDSLNNLDDSNASENVKIPETNITPRIYFCATMWHENLTEITQLMKSICRMDIDQNNRRMRRNYMKVQDPDYYEFEVDILFDDSMDNSSKTIQVSNKQPSVSSQADLTKSNTSIGDISNPAPVVPKEEKVMIVRTNQFVKLLIRAIKEAGESSYDSTVVIQPPVKYLTPYGGRLVWKLPGRNKIIVHLKNKKLIRHKKRWSQVMYMYYLLGFRHNKRIAKCGGDKLFGKEVAENTFILALDGDVDFQPISVIRLVDLMKKNVNVASACGRIHPAGSGPLVWYQKFEYALGHWLQKAAEHMIGCVLCSPGCFSLFRGSALMADNVARAYTKMAEEPWQMVQYDQGEDRWLCTLILQQGYRIEYSAASDAVTYSPEGFDEFFNQRRRWIPSTMANILDLLKTYRKTVALNETITFSYILYQAMMFVSTLIGPAVIMLLLVGSISATFYLTLWGSIALNMFPIVVFIIMCFKAKIKHQLLFAKVMAAVYAIAMLSFCVRAMLQIHEEGIQSPAAIFIIILVSVIFAASLLHPEEFKNVIYGFLYLLIIPTMYLMLIIYSICNLNVVSWGTREIAKVQLAMTDKKKENWARKWWKDFLSLKEYIPCIEEKTESTSQPTLPPTMSMNAFQRRFTLLGKQRDALKAGLFGNAINDPVSKVGLTANNSAAIPEIKILPVSPTETLATNQSSKMLNPIDIKSSVELCDMSLSSTLAPNNIPTSQPPLNSNCLNSLDINPPISGTVNNGVNESIKNIISTADTGTATGINKEEKSKDVYNWWNSTWMDDPDLPHGPVSALSADEIRFWEELIAKYLQPIEYSEEKKKEIADGLLQLRNKASFGFLLVNLIFIIIILMLQANQDTLNVKWHISGSKKYLKLEPLSLALLAFFVIILGIQFIAMLFHRWNTLLHILASTQLFCFRSNEKEIPLEIHSPEALKKTVSLFNFSGFKGSHSHISGTGSDNISLSSKHSIDAHSHKLLQIPRAKTPRHHKLSPDTAGGGQIFSVSKDIPQSTKRTKSDDALSLPRFNVTSTPLKLTSKESVEAMPKASKDEYNIGSSPNKKTKAKSKLYKSGELYVNVENLKQSNLSKKINLNTTEDDDVVYLNVNGAHKHNIEETNPAFPNVPIDISPIYYNNTDERNSNFNEYPASIKNKPNLSEYQNFDSLVSLQSQTGPVRPDNEAKNNLMQGYYVNSLDRLREANETDEDDKNDDSGLRTRASRITLA